MAMRSHDRDGVAPEYVVETTPSGVATEGLAVPRKRACYPDAWYLHLVRGDAGKRPVAHVRETLGDLSRYREVSYERLCADPAESCRGLFEWIGLEAGDDALEAVRSLSLNQPSDLDGVAPARGRSFARSPAPPGADFKASQRVL
jgi:hypothetical protein